MIDTISIKFEVRPAFPDMGELKLYLTFKNKNTCILSGELSNLLTRRKIEKKIPAEEVEKVLKKLLNSSVPAIPSFITGLDGTTFKLKIENGFNSVCYIWWSKLPQGYEFLKEVVKSLLNWAEVKEIEFP